MALVGVKLCGLLLPWRAGELVRFRGVDNYLRFPCWCLVVFAVVGLPVQRVICVGWRWMWWFLLVWRLRFALQGFGLWW